MTVYAIHFLLLFLYALIYIVSPRNKTSKFLFLLFTFGQTFLLYALRSKFIGTDTWSMTVAYASTNFSKFSDYMGVKAPLYYLLRDVFHFFVPSEQGYMVLCGIFIIGGTAWYIYRNSKNAVLSIFLFFALYFFFSSMNIARQFMAIVLAANGLAFITEEKKYPAFIFMFCALFIHSTAIILLPFLSLLFIKNTFYRRIFMVSYCIALITFSPLISLFTSLFPVYDSLYISSDALYHVGRNRKVLLTFFYLFLFVVFWLSYYKLKKHQKQTERNQWELYLCLLACTVIIGFLALKSVLLSRMEYYFSFTLILFVPLWLSKFNNQSKIILGLFTYLFFMIPGIFQFMANYGQIRPYLFFWE